MMNTKKKWLRIASIVLAICFVTSMAAIAGGQGVTGKVEKTSSGIVIQSGADTYMVMGKDLSPMVGKTVKATGTITEGAQGKTLKVTKVEEIKE